MPAGRLMRFPHELGWPSSDGDESVTKWAEKLRSWEAENGDVSVTLSKVVQSYGDVDLYPFDGFNMFQ